MVNIMPDKQKQKSEKSLLLSCDPSDLPCDPQRGLDPHVGYLRKSHHINIFSHNQNLLTKPKNVLVLFEK